MSASARPHSPKVKQEPMEDTPHPEQERSCTQQAGKRSRLKQEEEEDEDDEEEADVDSTNQLKSQRAVKTEPAAASSSSAAAASSSSSSAAASAPAGASRSKRAKNEPRVKSEPAAGGADSEDKEVNARVEVEQKAGADHEALAAAASAMAHAAPKEVEPERVRILQLDGSYAKLSKSSPPWHIRSAGASAGASIASSSAAAAASSLSSSSSAAAASAAGRSSVVYWMTREQRVQDNPGLLYAQQLAQSKSAELRIVFCLVPKYLEATERQYAFMLAGLREVERELRGLHISFEVLVGYAFDTLPAYARAHKTGAIVTDFGPLRISKEWSRKVCAAVAPTPLAIVDGHNVVPVWVASDKLEYAARTIRPKITRQLKQFLTEFPRVTAAAPPLDPAQLPPPIDWAALDASLEIDRRVKPVAGIVAGTAAAFDVLHDFIRLRLGGFASKRNDPNAQHISGLSPYLHFGQISPQRCALEVNKYRAVRSMSKQT